MVNSANQRRTTITPRVLTTYQERHLNSKGTFLKQQQQQQQLKLIISFYSIHLTIISSSYHKYPGPTSATPSTQLKVFFVFFRFLLLARVKAKQWNTCSVFLASYCPNYYYVRTGRLSTRMSIYLTIGRHSLSFHIYEHVYSTNWARLASST